MNRVVAQLNIEWFILFEVGLHELHRVIGDRWSPLGIYIVDDISRRTGSVAFKAQRVGRRPILRTQEPRKCGNLDSRPFRLQVQSLKPADSAYHSSRLGPQNTSIFNASTVRKMGLRPKEFGIPPVPFPVGPWLAS